jgi:hypothetical protein
LEKAWRKGRARVRIEREEREERERAPEKK